VRAVQAANPDVVLLASYPPDSVGMVRAATEVGLKTQLFGGAMVGMQYASLITQLSEKLNRVVNYHFFVPSPKMNFPGIEEFLKKYQAQAKDAGVDPLGFYQPPFAYAAMQVLQQADHGNRKPQRRQARRLHPRQFVQNDRGRYQVQRARRMGERARVDDPISRHPRAGARAIPDRAPAGDRFPGRI
jgi:ABC-type branched-chain amino acid transport systems, periplasmic component